MKTFTHYTCNELLNPPQEITIYKKDIEFKDGYGVSTFDREYRSIDPNNKEEIEFIDETLTYMAIVDENLEEILPYKGTYTKIVNFGNGHFLVTERFVGINTTGSYKRHEHYHIKIKENTPTIVDKFFDYDYEIIDEETIFVDGIFYNVKEGKVIESFPKEKIKNKCETKLS